MKRAAILSIGTELTRGEIVNTNASWLAERLTSLGLDVVRLETVADDALEIEKALRRLGQFSFVVCTGGLGPTTDDITSECVARFLGVPLRTDEASLQELTRRLQAYGVELKPSNAKQADFPEGARILPNRNGSAPGFGIRCGEGCQMFFMPGVPREMRPMFDELVAPHVPRHGGAEHLVLLRCFGSPEATLNDRMTGIEEAHSVSIGYRAHFPEVLVKVLARANTKAEAVHQAERAAVDARARLAEALYSEGESNMPEVAARALRTAGATLAVAESCTGGLLSSLLTAQPASDFFLGGVVTYANQVKLQQLGVEEDAIAQNGAVSAIVARQMAEGARQRFNSTYALSITGVAGPSGGTPDKPVGTVYYALSGPKGTECRLLQSRPRERRAIQLYASWCALNLLRETLE